MCWLTLKVPAKQKGLLIAPKRSLELLRHLYSLLTFAISVTKLVDKLTKVISAKEVGIIRWFGGEWTKSAVFIIAWGEVN